jgi:tRNA(adenine34) deaminase
MDHAEAMRVAIDEARQALDHDDVPVGAVVVIGGEIVANRHNERELAQDPTAHAEVLALRDAAAAVGSWRLLGASLVVTLEPCVMCVGAAISARVESIVYAATDPKAGATGSLYDIAHDSRLNHQCEVVAGVAAEESSVLLKDFFRTKRKPPTEL